MTEFTNYGKPISQLDRMEAKIDKLLAKKKRKPRKAVEYSNDFIMLWDIYPKRSGSNPKRKAFQAWRARALESTVPGWLDAVNDMDSGALRYAAYCDATSKTGTEFVLQTATFLGPDKHYLEDWHVDKALKLPRKNEALESFAAEYNLSKPATGESYPAYRLRLEREI